MLLYNCPKDRIKNESEVFTMTNKKTKSEIIEEMLVNSTIKEKSEWVDFLKNEKKLLEKKKESKKPTPKQMENETIKEEILSIMKDEREEQ